MKVQQCKKCNRTRLLLSKKGESEWLALTDNFAKILIQQNELEETTCEKCEQSQNHVDFSDTPTNNP